MRTYRKDVDDKIRQGIDWSDRLIEGDAITVSEWTVGNGLTATDASFDDYYSDIDLSGGTVGTTYKATNKVTTTNGLVYSKSFLIQVVEK
jgi:hypothetical protein